MMILISIHLRSLCSAVASESVNQLLPTGVVTRRFAYLKREASSSGAQLITATDNANIKPDYRVNFSALWQFLYTKAKALSREYEK